jgi:LAS superfamily LD-carboxypeptidase LdcB
MKIYVKQLVENPVVAVGVSILLVGVLGYAYFQISSLSEKVDGLTVALASSTAELQTTHAALEQKTIDISDLLYKEQQSVQAIQDRLGGFESTVGQITGTVGVLEKLSKTDPQLLQKYSKVYFLNENYVPKSLSEIPTRFLYTEKRAERIHTLVLPRLENMLAAATSSGVALYIKSAYRSFAEQQALKSSYTVTYGAGSANSFSADQGYSEHQLGTTVDFITTGTGGQLTGFEKTPAYQWLLNNAYQFGFILSYPKGNSYYIYEPWHWRYVGVALATYLHNQNIFFYNLEQRQIDDYLVTIFD